MNRIKIKFGEIIHNCIAHPLIPFLPKRWAGRFHDWTIERFWPPRNNEDE
jgi:hypothetical protein